jgi:hypothetical protein
MPYAPHSTEARALMEVAAHAAVETPELAARLARLIAATPADGIEVPLVRGPLSPTASDQLYLHAWALAHTGGPPTAAQGEQLAALRPQHVSGRFLVWLADE